MRINPEIRRNLGFYEKLTTISVSRAANHADDLSRFDTAIYAKLSTASLFQTTFF